MLRLNFDEVLVRHKRAGGPAKLHPCLLRARQGLAAPSSGRPPTVNSWLRRWIGGLPMGFYTLKPDRSAHFPSGLASGRLTSALSAATRCILSRLFPGGKPPAALQIESSSRQPSAVIPPPMSRPSLPRIPSLEPLRRGQFGRLPFVPNKCYAQPGRERRGQAPRGAVETEAPSATRDRRPGGGRLLRLPALEYD